MIVSGWLNILLLVVIAVAIGLLLLSFINLNKFDELRESNEKNKWLYFVFFILALGYLYYAFYVLNSEYNYTQLIVSSIFLAAA